MIVGHPLKLDIVGRLLKQDDNWQDVAIGTRFVADMPMLRVGWENVDCPSENVMGLVGDGFKPSSSPPVEQNPLGEWRRVNHLVLRNLLNGDLFTYVATSQGEFHAIADLCRVYGRRRRTAPNDLPIIEFAGIKIYHPPTKLSYCARVAGPDFKVVGWTRPRDIKIQMSDDILLCPCCGEECALHHHGVSIFDRKEDAEYVTKTQVVSLHDHDGIPELDYDPETGNSLVVSRIKSKGSGNPSSRRHGLIIHFYCEHCGDGIDLTLAQHKGSTLLEWRLPACLRRA